MQKIMIAATDLNGNIGYSGSNKLPWHIPEDLKFFKEKTKGYPMIMGYNTWMSLPGILPNRKHYVISKNHSFDIVDERVEFFESIESALRFAQQENISRVSIIGGAQIYNYVLEHNLVDEIYLTEVQVNLQPTEQFASVNMSLLKSRFELIDNEDIQSSTSNLDFILKTFKKIKN